MRRVSAISYNCGETMKDEHEYIRFKIKQFNKEILKQVVIPYGLACGLVNAVNLYTIVTSHTDLSIWYNWFSFIFPILVSLITVYVVANQMVITTMLKINEWDEEYNESVRHK